MIQDLKKDRVIVLTTHSMDEADVLSDKGTRFLFLEIVHIINTDFSSCDHGQGKDPLRWHELASQAPLRLGLSHQCGHH